MDNTLISSIPAGRALGLKRNWTLNTTSDFFVNKTEADDNAGTGKAVYDRQDEYNGVRQATRETSTPHVLYENAGDVFYASFLIAPARADGTMTFELELQDLDGKGVRNFSFGIINGSYTVGNGGDNVGVSDGSVAVKEQLVLARIKYGSDVSGANDNEAITVWVDPVDELSTPVINSTSVDLLNQGGGKVTSVSMRAHSMEEGPAFFDNLRVGRSFQSVVPEPATLSLYALGCLLLSFLTRRHF